MTEFALEIRNLKKVYKNKVAALKGIDLNVERGDFFALLGPNGAGKSTTIGILSSIVNKTSGVVKILTLILMIIFQRLEVILELLPKKLTFRNLKKFQISF